MIAILIRSPVMAASNASTNQIARNVIVNWKFILKKTIDSPKVDKILQIYFNVSSKLYNIIIYSHHQEMNDDEYYICPII